MQIHVVSIEYQIVTVQQFFLFMLQQATKVQKLRYIHINYNRYENARKN
jgi:hypothetical protein